MCILCGSIYSIKLLKYSLNSTVSTSGFTCYMGNKAELRCLVMSQIQAFCRSVTVFMQNCTVATRDSLLNPTEIIKMMFLKHFLPPRREGKRVSYCLDTKSRY